MDETAFLAANHEHHTVFVTGIVDTRAPDLGRLSHPQNEETPGGTSWPGVSVSRRQFQRNYRGGTSKPTTLPSTPTRSPHEGHRPGALHSHPSGDLVVLRGAGLARLLSVILMT